MHGEILMENRELVLEDYFKLRLLLNRTNLVRDQKTEVEFNVIQNGDSDYRLIATLSGIENPKHVELCESRAIIRWKSAGHTSLIYLEEFCAKFLKQNLMPNFSKKEMNKAVSSLKKELQSLGISAQ